jgi:hypothetical protein
MKINLFESGLLFLGVHIFTFGFSASVCAADMSRSEASSLITSEAERLCIAPPIHHTDNGIGLTVDGEAKLKGLIRSLADGGVEAAAKVSHDDAMRAVTENQLAAALKDTNDCRASVIKTLNASLNPERSGLNCSGSANGASIATGNNAIIQLGVCAGGSINNNVPQ